MGYEDPTRDVNEIVQNASLLQSLIKQYYDYLPETVHDRFMDGLKPLAKSLGELVDLLSNYGPAAMAVAQGDEPRLPKRYFVRGWTAIAGTSVWRVEHVGDRVRDSLTRNPEPASDAEIAIYLDKYSDSDLERVQDAALELATSLGYEDFSLLDEELGSIFKRWGAKLRSGIETDYVQRRMEEIEERTSFEIVGKVLAENDAIKTDSAVRLIASLADIPNAVARVGAILIVKQTVHGTPNVMIRELNTREIRALEQNPGIQRDPSHALELLAIAVGQIDSEIAIDRGGE